jgi:hypothetical protein
MSKPDIISPEEGVELKRLYSELEVATRTVNVVFMSKGMESEAFFKADQELGAIIRRIKEIYSLVGKHWMEI